VPKVSPRWEHEGDELVPKELPRVGEPDEEVAYVAKEKPLRRLR